MEVVALEAEDKMREGGRGCGLRSAIGWSGIRAKIELSVEGGFVPRSWGHVSLVGRGNGF